MLNIIPCHDARLCATSKEVSIDEISAKRIQDIIDQMFEIALGKSKILLKA